MDVPGPSTHQEIISKPIHFDEAFKSFNVGATRFPAINKVTYAKKVWFCGELKSERI